jgi:hypothetical protein
MGKEKDKAIGRPVKNRDILKIDELCLVLKTGTRHQRYLAQSEILSYFDAYLEKYVNILLGASSDCNNYDTKGFLAMFLTGRPKDMGSLIAQKKYIGKVLSRFAREEVKQEMILLFLSVLDRYRIVPGVNALNPLTTIFRWRVKDWFNKLVKDPLAKTYEPSYVEDEEFSIESFIEKILDYSEQDLDESTYSSFDMGWVYDPKDNVYSTLTRYERYILSLLFNQGMNSSEIGRVLSITKIEVAGMIEDILLDIRGAMDG